MADHGIWWLLLGYLLGLVIYHFVWIWRHR
jgi:hypothetical protein